MIKIHLLYHTANMVKYDARLMVQQSVAPHAAFDIQLVSCQEQCILNSIKVSMDMAV